MCRSSDLAASGAGNGSVRLWAIESETKDIRPLFDLPLVSQSNIVTKLHFVIITTQQCEYSLLL